MRPGEARTRKNSVRVTSRPEEVVVRTLCEMGDIQ